MSAPVARAVQAGNHQIPRHVEIVRAVTAADQIAVLEIRRQIFAFEQGVADLRVSDPDDGRSLNALARVRVVEDGQIVQRPVATGRLTPALTTRGQALIAWVATLPEYRGQGIGSALMRFLLDAADDAGMHEVILAAQAHAEDFYRRLGFKAAGSHYDVRGIPHLRMVRRRPRSG